MTGNRTELWGRITGPTELRSTPTGTAILRLTVACGTDDDLVMTAVMIGDGAREITPRLRPGLQVRVVGRLRVAARGRTGIGKTGIEVIADSVELLD